MRLIDADALVDRLSEEAKRLAEIAIHSKGQAVDYYTGMKTGMARAAIWANGTPTGEPTVDAEWMLKHGMIQDADFPAIDAVPVVRCKDCKHRPIDMGGHNYGQDLFFPDEDNVCPCQCDDQWYSWMPGNDWFCANGERSEDGET